MKKVSKSKAGYTLDSKDITVRGRTFHFAGETATTIRRAAVELDITPQELIRDAMERLIDDNKSQPKLRKVLDLDSGLEIFLDSKNQPWVRKGRFGCELEDEKPERTTFAAALREYAKRWSNHRNGNYGDDADYRLFFAMVADKLPEGV